MKIYLFLALGCFFATVSFAQSAHAAAPLKFKSNNGDIVLASQSLQSDAIYPGCSKSMDGFEVSTCFTNLISNGIAENLKNSNIQSECGSEPLTIKLKIDETGKMTMDSISGPGLTEMDKKSFETAVEKINQQLASENKVILPAISKGGDPVTIYKNIPFVLEGKGYYNYDNFQVNGVPYKVYRNCQNFYIKKGDDDSSVDIIKGEQQYQQFKNEITTSSDTQLSKNSKDISEK